MRLLDALFDHETIDGDGRVATYLDRWVLRRGRSASWYLHKFTGSDWSTDLHDHPKPFLSIGLLGSYVEQTSEGERRYRAPWIRTFAPEHAHRVELDPGSSCWTLVRVGKTQREWGFWCDGQWVQWELYVRGSLPERRGAVRAEATAGSS